MDEVSKFILATIVLFIGFPIGNFLAKKTKEELKSGQVWFKILILICVVGTILSLILRNDYFLFSFLFIVIVTSGSLRAKRGK